jgi:thiol-disulfide isomerase/thioredoxin
MKYLPLFLLALLIAPVAFAQEGQTAETTPQSEECAPTAEVDVNAPLFDEGTGEAVPAEAPLTEAEQTVQALIAEDGVHVVHFWAPWCGNSIAELDAGWTDLVNANEEVSFTFVTIWNNGNSGEHLLDRYALAGRITELTQPDNGPSSDKSQRRRAFLGLPVTWIPSTWVFHKNGELAFAMNYGEMPMETIQQLIDATRSRW